MTSNRQQSESAPSQPRRQPVRSVAAVVVALAAIGLAKWFGLPLSPVDSPPTAARPAAAKTATAKPAPAKPAPEKPAKRPVVAAGSPASPASPAAAATDAASDQAVQRVVVRNVTIKDLDGQVVYRGDVDLTDSLTRIAAGKRLEFHHDGITFQNRERRLPLKPAGHYREFVHPTPQLDGPGPQRIVTGRTGEVYYTHDHYRTFQRIRGP